MGGFFFWSGVCVWAAVALALLWGVVWELCIVGLATSISYHRWALSSPTSRFAWWKHGHRLLWSVAVKSFEYWGYRNTGNVTITNQGTGAQWRGVGDWDSQSQRRGASET